MGRVAGSSRTVGRARPRLLPVALVAAVLGCAAWGCDETRAVRPTARTRLLDSWLAERDPGVAVELGPLGGVSRRGFAVAPGIRQRFRVALPERARFHAMLGMGGVEPRVARVDLTECGSASEAADGAGPLLSTAEVRSDAWSEWTLDLGGRGGTVVELCFATRFDSSDGADPLPVWLAGAEIESVGAKPWPPGRPNVLLITLDSTRGDHLSSAGYPRPTTPNLDRLASYGDQFLNAVSNSASALPSHASLFTGLHAWDHGVHGTPDGEGHGSCSFIGLDSRFVTLAEQFWMLGYHTAGIVAGPLLRAELGFAQGFDYFDQATPRADVRGDSPDVRRGRDASEVTDRALAWLDRIDGPFFLFLHYFDPHWPYRPPEEFARDWVAPDDESIPTNESERIRNEVLGGRRELSDSERRSMLDHYDAEIAAVDAQIGRLLDALRARGSYASTMIVVVSDHGESFGEHQLIDHGNSLFEQQLRSALIVKYARVGMPRPVNRKFDHRVDLLDVYESIAEEVGLSGDVPVGQHRVGRFQLSETPGLHRRRPFHFASQGRQPCLVDAYGPRFDRDLEAIYHEDWKLITDDRGRLALFDLATDPDELRDLSPREPAVVAELIAERRRWGGAQPFLGAGEPAEVAPETAEWLRSLEYLESREATD